MVDRVRHERRILQCWKVPVTILTDFPLGSIGQADIPCRQPLKAASSLMYSFSAWMTISNSPGAIGFSRAQMQRTSQWKTGWHESRQTMLPDVSILRLSGFLNSMRKIRPHGQEICMRGGKTRIPVLPESPHCPEILIPARYRKRSHHQSHGEPPAFRVPPYVGADPSEIHIYIESG